MSDILASGLAVLNEKLTAFASTAWTYRRSSSSCTVSITEERQKLQVTDLRGGTRFERPDFVGTFDASELNFGAGVVEPQAGDTIERAFGGTTKKYRLPTKNIADEPGWHYTDPQQGRLRIFGEHYADT